MAHVPELPPTVTPPPYARDPFNAPPVAAYGHDQGNGGHRRSHGGRWRGVSVRHDLVLYLVAGVAGSWAQWGWPAALVALAAGGFAAGLVVSVRRR